ncbi:MAG TPA: TetR/AcrR family transcriptional regulator [Bacteroidia bacterium]|nr:TetR/AcrR family transcriptional regulator [Bacteroidia bacterium]
MARIRDEQKVELIYQAALELVLKQGFSGLKMADVAVHAGLATGTVYIYFKDKETLIHQLYNHLKKKCVEMYAEGLEGEDSFRKLVRRLWKQFFNFCIEHSAEVAFLEQYHRSPYLKSQNKKDSNYLYGPFLDMFSRGLQEKRLIKADKEIILALLVGPVHEMIRLHRDGTLKITPSVIDSTFEHVWECVKR